MLVSVFVGVCFQVGLLGPDGQDLQLHLEGKGDVGTSTVLRCDAAENTFTFTDVPVSSSESRPLWSNSVWAKPQQAPSLMRKHAVKSLHLA